MGAHESPVDDNGVVRLGSVVFALIRPAPGRERAFNHWYERDHYYTAGLAAPGVFSGGRFVHPETGWHLALYFVLPGHEDRRIEFATDQVRLAAADDRLFDDREHLHTWSYEVDSAHTGPDGVPPALALDHRYAALAVSMYDRDPSPVVGPALVLRPRARIMPSAWDGEFDPTTRRTVVAFGASAPPPVEGAVWSGAFVPMVFGTDTHVGG